MNLADFLKISAKGGSVHQLIHRARHVEAPWLPGRNTGSAGSENREMSPREPQKEGKRLICQTKTLALLSEGIVFFRERVLPSGDFRIQTERWGSVTVLSLVEGPGGKLPDQAI